MNWTLVSILGLWVPVTFWVHCALHEGSHALAAHAVGWRSGPMTLWPSRQVSGRWTWASVVLYPSRPTRKSDIVLVFTAPLTAEVLWIALTVTVAALTNTPWLLIELIPACLDIGTWLAGLITKTPGCDAQVTREALTP